MDAVIGALVDYTVKPILHQLHYLLSYKENIDQLHEQLDTLRTTKDCVQKLVSEDTDKGNATLGSVTKWLDNAEKEINMAEQNERESSSPSCFNFVKRHQLSRKAKKSTENISKLINDGKEFNKDNVGYSVPSSDTQSTTLRENYQIINSRTTVAEQIKDALADPNINTVGVWGMGGVGKTAFLKEVCKLVLESKLFDRVINVEVGQSKSVIEIQELIRVQLNTQLPMQCKEVRASRLRTQIVGRKENILFMLDDLWKEYDLEDIGIPFRSKTRKDGCKIVMTSRNRDIIENQMNAEKLFQVDLLTEEESWKFFVTIVGEFVQHDIEPIAKNVVKECGRLPIALKIVAKVLKRKPVHTWRDAFNRLTNHAVVNIPGVSKELYSCLKFSYDSVEKEAKSLFLLCSVFPDDHKIYVEDLQMHAMGMGLLDHLITWRDARCRVFKLVTDLKSSYLLLESDKGDDYVQMHDVVRDVAKYIASEIDKTMSSLSYGFGQSEWQEEYRCGSYNAIFVDCKDIPNLPPKLEFPNLQLLILRNDYLEMRNSQIPDAFFAGMEKLRVLDMRGICYEPTKTFHSLKNLQTLCMYGCGCNDINTIGQLKKLKILKISECMGIEELPVSMLELTELKVLEVSFSFLWVIPSNIISSMKKLEKLCLGPMSFRRWGEEVSYENKLIKNVKLSELNCLTRLSHLSLEIPNVDMLSNELSLERGEKLEEFCIFMGENDRFNYARFFKYTAKTLVLDIQSPIMYSIGGLLEKLLQKCEKLRVKDSVGFAKLVCNPNENYVYPHLKHLKIWIVGRGNSDMSCTMIENITPFFYLQVSFPELKKLTIEGENNSEMLWHKNGLTANSFCKLQRISIEGCNKVRYVFPSHMVASLVLLKVLKVSTCELVETIIEMEEQHSDVMKELSLTILDLRRLPNLKHVRSKDPVDGELRTFPNLKKVKIHKCPHLKILFPLTFINHMDKIESLHADSENEIFAEEGASKLVFQDQIELFPNLRDLAIHCKQVEKGRFWLRSESFPKLRSLHLFGSKDDSMVSLPLEMSKLLYSIEKFEIQIAFNLVQVFRNGDQDQNNHNQSRRAKLKSLELFYLPKLTQVWEDNTQMTPTHFDSLDHIIVERCKKLKYVLPSSITFFNLTSLAVEYCNGMMNLFSSAVAKSLVNLSSMNISHCRRMTYIMVAEGGKDGEEEKGEEIIIFKKLFYFRLYNLASMVSFCSEKCTLEFPNLEQLEIRECPEMKTFSYGVLSTPKLPDVQTEEGHILLSPIHGVNFIIQYIWKNKYVKNLLTQQCEDNNEEHDSEECEEIREVYEESSDQ